MAYNKTLANRISEAFADLPDVEEKEMMGGLVFMYNGKMCVGVVKDELMCRIDPLIKDELLEKTGCREMDFTGRSLKSYVLVDETGMKNKKDFNNWIGLAIAFNPKAKASKKRK